MRPPALRHFRAFDQADGRDGEPAFYFASPHSLLGDEAILLLRWHGAVIVGKTLQEALFRAIQRVEARAGASAPTRPKPQPHRTPTHRTATPGAPRALLQRREQPLAGPVDGPAVDGGLRPSAHEVQAFERELKGGRCLAR